MSRADLVMGLLFASVSIGLMLLWFDTGGLQLFVMAAVGFVASLAGLSAWRYQL